MSNPFTDQLVDRAIDIVAEKMEKNPSIPEEARPQLEKEEFDRLMAEGEKHEDEWEENEGEPTGHIIPMTDEQLLQHEKSFINSFTE